MRLLLVRRSLTVLFALVLVWVVVSAIGVSATSGLLEVSTDTTLVEDHNGNIVIVADNITLDCDGHNVTGTGSGVGVLLVGRTGVTVTNCAVTNFATGIHAVADNSVFVNNRVLDSKDEGYAMGGTGNTFTENGSYRNGGYGFEDSSVPGTNSYADNICFDNASGPSSPDDLCSRGYAGATRYGTAAAISQSEFDPGVDVVYVATGTNFPDALAGVPVAGLDQGPILLSGSIPGETATELTRLEPKKIVILGGTSVVSPADATKLASYTTGPVERLAGADRYGTAAAISASRFTPGVPVAYIATGASRHIRADGSPRDGFPDALAGGPVAAIDGGPILLVNQYWMPPATATELSRLQPDKIVILGGGGVVGTGVEDQLKSFTTGPVERLWGETRYGTAAAISASQFSPGVDVVYIATGAYFPDALAGGPVAAINGGPILLVTRPPSRYGLPPETATELARLQPHKIIILGGTGAVSPTLEAELAGYLR